MEKMKKGFIRSLEAVIAIVLFLLVFYTFLWSPVAQTTTIDPVQYSLQAVAGRVLYNETLRQDVLSGDYISLDGLLAENLPQTYSYSYVVCHQANCIAEQIPPNKEIFKEDVYITSTYSSVSPAILRMYAWKR